MKLITSTQNLRRNIISFFLGLFLFSIMVFNTESVYAQFTVGNLVVEQIGDGSTTLGSAATTVKLLQFTPTGTSATGTAFFGSTGTPTTSPFNIVDSGSATSNGYISLSTDKTFVVIPGYNAPNATASIAGSASATYGRTIGKVTYSGVLQTNGTFNALTGNNYRSIASNGSSYYMAGGIGIVYTPNDATSNTTTTATSIFTTNTRILTIFNNTLFASTSSTSFNGTGSNLGIYQVGSFNSLPTATVTAGTAINIINTLTGSSPYGFAFSPDGLTCFVADDRATTAGGVQKWTYSGTFSNTTGWSGGTWSLAYTLGTGATNIGARGLSVDFSGTNPIIYGTSAESSLNRVFKITDTGASSTASTLVTATVNYIFRGICFAPQAPATISIAEGSNFNMAANIGSVSTQAITVSGSGLSSNIGLSFSGTDASLFSIDNNSLSQTGGTATITFTPTSKGSFSASLNLTSGATVLSVTLNGSSSGYTGISKTENSLKVTSEGNKLFFTSLLGDIIEVYNSVGQKLVQKQAVEGLNIIPVLAKGVMLVKVGNRSAKVIL